MDWQLSAQGFHAVTRKTIMAPARGVFFFSQGIGAQPRQTPTISTYQVQPQFGTQAAVKPSTAPNTRVVTLTQKQLGAIKGRAMRGSLRDQYQLGLIFARGLNGRRDTELARHWFSLAASKNYQPARTALVALNRSGSSAKKTGAGRETARRSERTPVR